MNEDERPTREQLVMVDATVRALDRRDEVLHVMEDSEDEDEARRRVGQLLGVDELGSRVVLDMQLRSFTRSRRRIMASHAEELRKRLAEGP